MNDKPFNNEYFTYQFRTFQPRASWRNQPDPNEDSTILGPYCRLKAEADMQGEFLHQFTRDVIQQEKRLQEQGLTVLHWIFVSEVTTVTPCNVDRTLFYYRAHTENMGPQP